MNVFRKLGKKKKKEKNSLSFSGRKVAVLQCQVNILREKGLLGMEFFGSLLWHSYYYMEFNNACHKIRL